MLVLISFDVIVITNIPSNTNKLHQVHLKENYKSVF